MYNYEFDPFNELESIKFITTIAKDTFDKYSHKMTVPGIRLLFELSYYNQDRVCSAITNCWCIVLFPDSIYRGALYDFYCMHPDSESSGPNIYKHLIEELKLIIEIFTKFVILHEMAHTNQVIQAMMMNNLDYISIIENSADMFAIDTIRKDYWTQCPDDYTFTQDVNQTIVDAILDRIIKSSYNRPFMQVASFKYSLFDYYYHTMQVCMYTFMNTTDENFGYMLYEFKNISFMNKINDNNIEVIIKKDDVFLPPTKDYIDLISNTYKCTTSSSLEVRASYEVPDDRPDDAIITFEGNVLSKGFTRDVYKEYGLADNYYNL